MRYILTVKPEAELDIMESSKWYEEQRSELGHHFLDAVNEKISLIEKNPLHYQERYKQTRFALLKGFPYAIHFKLEEGHIYVIAVLSTYRNPQIWKG